MESGRKGQALAVFAATAGLMWFGNGMTPWWPLMWLAPFPALWYSLRSSWRPAGVVAAAGWLAGSVNLLAYCRMLGLPFPAWLALFGGMALLFAAGVLLFRLLVMRGAVWSGVLALPALWVSVEWLRNWVTPHGTAGDLAYTQLKFLPFLQLASLTGPWGMSFVLLLTPSIAAAAFYLRRRASRRAAAVGLAGGGVLLSVLLFGVLRLMQPGAQPSMQVGLATSDEAENAGMAAAGADAERLLEEYVAQARLLGARGAQAIVIPEKLAFVRDEDALVQARLQQAADASGATIVAGEVHVTPAAGGVERQYNRAMVYTPHAVAASYDKEHMLPPFESSLTPGTAKWTRSQNGAVWGVAICKDMDFTSMARAYGRLNAGVMLVPAWDFKVDRTWHGHMAIMRGVEGGFSVVRAAKGGSLYVSDDRGRVLAETRSDAAPFATLLATVPVGHERTLFAMWGDWFAWVAVAVLVGVLLRAFARG